MCFSSCHRQCTEQHSSLIVQHKCQRQNVIKILSLTYPGDLVFEFFAINAFATAASACGVTSLRAEHTFA